MFICIFRDNQRYSPTLGIFTHPILNPRFLSQDPKPSKNPDSKYKIKYRVHNINHPESIPLKNIHLPINDAIFFFFTHPDQ